MEQNKINEVIKTTFENIDKFLSVKKIIGETIIIGEDEIIPIININMLYLSGGGEYGKKTFTNNKNLPFSIANGTSVSVKPCAFLVKQKNNDFKVINIGTTNYEKVLNNLMDFVKDNI